VEYLKTPPDANTIVRLAGLLGMPVSGLLRRGEAEFREATDLPDIDDDAALAAWLVGHPKVIERPIVVNAAFDKAVIGRPPENVLEVVDR
jgi:arsenate reductase